MANSGDFKWLRAGGIAALVREGKGGTIVIVPGGMADAQGWLPVATALQTSLSIAIVNRRGRAPSDDLPPGSTVADEVRDVRALMSKLSGPFVVFGWSHGGLLAMEAAIGRSDIDAIILYEPVCRPFVSSAIDPIQRAVEAGDLDQAVTEVVTKVGGASSQQMAELRATPAWEYLKPLVVRAATELTALNQHEPDFAGYGAIKVPVSILIGSLNLDQEPYGEATNRFCKALPQADQIILADQGHLAHAEAPNQLAAVVSEVLAAKLP